MVLMNRHTPKMKLTNPLLPMSWNRGSGRSLFIFLTKHPFQSTCDSPTFPAVTCSGDRQKQAQGDCQLIKVSLLSIDNFTLS